MSKQREAFEAWANEKGIPLVMSKCLMLDELRPTLLAWKAWQASRAAALEEAAEKAEATVCVCCHSEEQRDVADEIAFEIRALKEQS